MLPDSDPEIIEFPFKGERQYVHGTDVFNMLMTRIDSFDSLSLSFHQRLGTPCCRLEDVTDQTINPKREHVLCQIDTVESGSRRLALRPFDKPGAEVRRIAYDEDQVYQAAELSEGQVRLNHPTALTFIEELVALTKLLHRDRFEVSGGQWFFSRLDLSLRPRQAGPLCVKMIDNLGTRLTRSSISNDDGEIGIIFFSFVKT